MPERKSVLKTRAEKLAQITSTQHLIQNEIEVLSFKLAQEQYAIETKHIKEVYPCKEYTILPGAPAFIFGLINIRRKILSILDLKVFFGLPSTNHPNPKLIILEGYDMEFALLTDEILDIQKIPLDHLQTNLPTLTGIRQDFLKGVTQDRMVILDGKKLLTSKQIVVDETVEI